MCRSLKIAKRVGSGRKVDGAAQFWMGLFMLAAWLIFQAGTALAEPVSLKFATTIPPNNPLVADFFEPWAKKVNEASGGDLNIQVISGPTLANASNVWERTVNQVTDIGWGIHGAVGLPFPKSDITSLPSLVEDLVNGSIALWRLYSSGLIADEYKGVRVIGLAVTPGSLISSKKPITKLEDMKGLKVRAANRMVADVITALGGAPIAVPVPEIYQSLQKGVINACVAGWTVANNFRIYEVTGEHLEGVALGEPCGFVVMNVNSYEKLSPKAKAALDQHSGEYFARELGAWFKKDASDNRERIRAMKGQTIHTVDAKEKERWNKALEPVIQGWVGRTQNGDKVLASFKEEPH